MTLEDKIMFDVGTPINKKIILNVMYAQNAILEKFNELLKPFDISAEQFNVLRILRGQKGCPANMCLIQERMIAKTSNTTRLVDKLLIKELVTRKVCSENRRKIEVLITSKGLKLLSKLDPKVVANEKHFCSNLTLNELDQLNLLLMKLQNNNNN